MTQFVNNTDERIVLEPNEGVSGKATEHQYEGTMYRLTLEERREGPKESAEFPTARDFMDRMGDE